MKLQQVPLKNFTNQIKYVVFSLLFLASQFIVVASIIAPKSAHAVNPTGITNIGHIGGLNAPIISEAQDVAVDQSGNIFVFDGNNRRVLKYDSSGNFVIKFGMEGTGDGEFGYSYGIVADLSGNIYVADTNNNRIQKFDNDGNFVTKWGSNGGDGSTGTGNGEFDNPRGITTDSSGNVYVADMGNGRVQKFDSSGTYISQFACNAKSVALDSIGNIFIVGSEQIQKFDSSGTYISQFGTSGSNEGQFSGLSDIAIDSDNTIYTIEEYGNRAQKFDSSGNFISQFGTSGSDNGQFDVSRGIALDSSSNIYVADTNNNRIQKFDNSGTFIELIGSDFSDAILAYSVAASTDGGVYVPHLGQAFESFGSSDNEVRHYATNGSLLSSWETGEENFQTFPYTLAVSSEYVYNLIYYEDQDTEGLKIKKTDLSGSHITEWNLPSLDDAFGFGLAVDSQDNVYYFAGDSGRVYKYSTTGNLLNQFGSLGTGEGEFAEQPYPFNTIAVDSQDNLYVADTSNRRVQKFDSNGVFISQFGSEGSGDGEFMNAFNLTVGPDDSIYVGDNQEETGFRIQKFDNDGIYLNQYTQGSDEVSGSPFLVYGISAGPNGIIYTINAESFKIEILCDNDVSTDGCVSTGSADNTVTTLSSAENATPITLSQTGCTTVSNSSATKESNLTTADPAYSYPIGLIAFTLNGCTNGGTATITATFTGSFDPSSTTIRKYNSSNNTYTTLTQSNSNLSLSVTTLNNQPALQVSYSITDGGPLDQDNTVNGTIVDPVGLAQASVGVPETGL